jgi:hypothetical protein
MANTTLSQLTSIVGTAVAPTDSFLIYDVSANTDKQITASELKNMVGNGSFTFTISGASDALIVTSTDAGATAAPDIVFYRNSASPAASDAIGNIVFRGKSSTGVDRDYAGIFTHIVSPTNAAETGQMTFNTMNAGTSAERMRIRAPGGVAIGYAGADSATLALGKNLNGATVVYGIYNTGEVQSVVTGGANMFTTAPSVAATTFTLGNLRHFYATQGTIGAGATVTNQYGFFSENNLIGATNNYGFYAVGIPAANVTTGKIAMGVRSEYAIATGGGTSWNFYSGGTAPNHFLGNVAIGATTQTEKLTVTGNIKATQQVAGGYTAHAAGTTAMALGTNTVVKVTPNAGPVTFTTTVAPAGSRASVIIVTSGTTSYTITFGTGFLTTGTLATGTTTAKTFVIEFVSDGTTMIETSRTTAM